jgi:hypothetical protein
MPNEPHSAIGLFDLFCMTNSVMIQVATLFRSQSKFSEVVRTNDVRKYEESLSFESYVDMEAPNGIAFSWAVEFRFENGEWIVNASLRKSDKSGQDKLQEFPSKVTNNFDDFLQKAVEATKWILECAREFDSGGIPGTQY